MDDWTRWPDKYPDILPGNEFQVTINVHGRAGARIKVIGKDEAEVHELANRVLHEHTAHERRGKLLEEARPAVQRCVRLLHDEWTEEEELEMATMLGRIDAELKGVADGR